jgi:uncharacterized integral membrane protein
MLRLGTIGETTMAKIKIFLLVLITFVITYFIIENSIPAPPIKLFGKELIQIQLSVIIIVSFLLGLIFGWLICFSWKRSRKNKQGVLLGEEKAPESQNPSQQEEKK